MITADFVFTSVTSAMPGISCPPLEHPFLDFLLLVVGFLVDNNHVQYVLSDHTQSINDFCQGSVTHMGIAVVCGQSIAFKAMDVPRPLALLLTTLECAYSQSCHLL